MARANLKTTPTQLSVADFLDRLPDETQRTDSLEVVRMMAEITGEKPKMWGPAIIGFGSRKLVYESGRELDWMKVGFSPRKGNLTLYVLEEGRDDPKLLAKLGKHTRGKSCLHIKRLSDVDEGVLKKLIAAPIHRAEAECGKKVRYRPA